MRSAANRAEAALRLRLHPEWQRAWSHSKAQFYAGERNSFAAVRITTSMKIKNPWITALLSAALTLLPVGALAQSASQDMHNAGENSKAAAKDTGRGVKKGTKKSAHATKKGTKKAWNKTKNTTSGAVNGGKAGAKQPD